MARPETSEFLDPQIADQIAQRVRIAAGMLPQQHALVLTSPERFLEARLSEHATAWTIHAATEPVDGAPEGIEAVQLDLDDEARLPFEDDSLGLVTGAYLTQPLSAWSPELAKEFARVLAPGGSFQLVFRAPSPSAPKATRSLPEHAEIALKAAGFTEIAEVQEARLEDESWSYRLSATAT